jgi:hypothetical protein
MTGREFFFFGVMVIGIGVLGTCGLAGLRARRWGLDDAERSGLQLALEFSLLAVVFALVPFAMHALFVFEAVAWQLSSLVLAALLLAQITRIGFMTYHLGARWPAATISLLVLSAILLTIELVNVIWWRGFSGYAVGLLWVLLLACVQFVAFVSYGQQSTEAAPVVGTIRNYAQDRVAAGDSYHGILGERLRRNSSSGNPNRAPHAHRYTHRDPIHYARRQRYADRLANPRARHAHRRPFADTAAGRDYDDGW